MAQQTTITYVSDLSGSSIEGEDNPTVEFALDGQAFAIDLTTAEQKKFRDFLSEYQTKGKRVTRTNGKATSKAKSTGPNPADIRAWARENGHEVPDRGRVSAEVREAYEAAH